MKVGDIVRVKLDSKTCTNSKQFNNYRTECRHTFHAGKVVYITAGEGCGIEFDHKIYNSRLDLPGANFHNAYCRGKDYQCGYFFKEDVQVLEPINKIQFQIPVTQIPVIPSWDEMMEAMPMSFNSLLETAKSDRIMATGMSMMAGADWDIDKPMLAGQRIGRLDRGFQPIGPEEVLLCR